MDDPKFRNEGKTGPAKPAPPGVGTPFAGESSSSNAQIPQPDSASGSSADAQTIFPGSDKAINSRPAPPEVDPDLTLVPGAPIPTKPAPSRTPNRMSGMFVSAAVWEVGDLVGGRYEILQLLGEGGMGAVYKATDRELDRFVALKVIRPELASNPEILARFKQELLLAHQVTHRNVIRIYDLGEADGVKFITMEFIEGSDLRSLLHKEGRLPTDKVVEIVRQICLALEVAHGVGVIHRDLKPQNVMRDPNGRILVMDFGLARSIQSDGMTQTGALVGTMEYMSPEQAMGKELDQRSDIFAVGLIFFELLTGKTPYKADTALASLLKRSQERAIPAVEIDAGVPKGLSDIVSKCLERDLTQRYQNVTELLADIAAWQGNRPVAASMVGMVPNFLTAPPSEAATATPRRVLPTKWIAIGVVVCTLAAGGIVLRSKFSGSGSTNVAKGPVTSLAIMPLHNASGDPSLDWLGLSIAEMLTTDVGQSAGLRTVSADRLHQILTDLHITGDTQLDPQTLKQLGGFSNAQTIISGQYSRTGGRIHIELTLRNLAQGQNTTLKAEAASEKETPAAVDQLAQSIREHLALSQETIKELRQQAFRPSTNSMDALRAYNEGLELMRQGNNLGAQKKFETATQADAGFALAFARLGQSYSNLGYDNEAERYSKKAVELSGPMPAPAKYLIEANYARLSNNSGKAIESYGNLAKMAPDDSDVQFALAGVYESSNKFDQALEHYNKVLELDPKSVDALLAIGRVDIKNGKPQESLDFLNRALSLAVQLENEQEKGAIIHYIGHAYRGMNKPQDALKNYQDALAIRRKIGDKKGIAASLNEGAVALSMLGKFAEAEKDYKEALQIRREIGDKRGLGDTLIDLGNLSGDRGKQDEALGYYKESLQIQRDLGNELNEANCLNNIGTAYLAKGQYDDALTYYQQTLQLREKLKVPDDLADAIRNIAVTNTKLGQYDQAITQYLKALDLHRSVDNNQGVAMGYYDMGTVFQYQGRYGAALKTREDALNAFRKLKDRSFWMVQSLCGYGESLASVGREDDAKRSLDEAMALAKELSNDSSIAQIQQDSGNVALYRGDVKAADAFYGQALQSAIKAKDPEQEMIARIAKARMDLLQGRSPAAIAALKKLVQQGETQGLKYETTEASLDLAEALLKNGANAQARQEAERALTRSQKLGMRWLEARSNYLLGSILRQGGNARAAADSYRAAVNTWDELQKEVGNPAFLSRVDLAQMYRDAQHWQNGASQ